MARKLENWLSVYGKMTSVCQESPSIFHLWVGIATISGVLGRKIWIQHPPSALYSNLYIVLVSPPGKSRKSAAISTGVRLMGKIQGVNLSAEELSRQALIRDMANSANTFLIGDKLITHSSLTAVTSELSVFLGIKNLPLLATLCKLFDCEDKFAYRTIHRKMDLIINPWLSILGATTPDWLVSSLPMDAIGGGFTSRVIFVVSEDRGNLKPRGKPPPEAIKMEIDLIDDLVDISIIKGEFSWSKDAGEMYDDWYINYKPPTTVNWLAGYFERKPSHIVKTAMILAISESSELVIEKCHLEEAFEIFTMTELEMPRAFSGIGRHELSQDTFRVLRLIETAGSIKQSSILAKNWQHFGKYELERIVDTLVAAHKVKRELKNGDWWFEMIDE